MSKNEFEACPHCHEWLELRFDHHVSGTVDGKEVFLHADWCVDAYEGDHNLENRKEHNRKNRVHS